MVPFHQQKGTVPCYLTLYRLTAYIYIYMSYRTANFQTLHFKYLFNKYPYWIFLTCCVISVLFSSSFIMLPCLVPILTGVLKFKRKFRSQMVNGFELWPIVYWKYLGKTCDVCKQHCICDNIQRLVVKYWSLITKYNDILMERGFSSNNSISWSVH
jgi:hypothetical protein